MTNCSAAGQQLLILAELDLEIPAMPHYQHPEFMLQPLQAYPCLQCRGNVEVVIDGKDGRGAKKQLLKDLDLEQVLDRDVENLSGGRQSTPVLSSLSKCIS